MAEIRNLTRNGETFYPLTTSSAVINESTGEGMVIDDVPIAGSDNLVKSGGVYSSFKKYDEIDKQTTSSEIEESIVINDNFGDEIINIGNTEINTRNIIKCNNVPVLTAEQTTTGDSDDYFVFVDNQNVECVKIDKNGISLVEDGYYKNIRDYIITTKNNTPGAIYLRDYIKTNYIVDNRSLYFGQSENPTSFINEGYLDNKIKTVPEGKHFIFVTDVHWESSVKRSNYLIDYVKNRLNINKVVFGGDVLDEIHNHPDQQAGSYSSYLASQKISDFSEEYFSCLGESGIWCEGNHDGNIIGYEIAVNQGLDTSDNYERYLIPDQVLFNKTIKFVEGAKFDEIALNSIDNLSYTQEQKSNIKAFLKMCYYVDDKINKIRFIVVDTGVGALSEVIYLGQRYWESNRLFFKSLIRFLRSTPEGYDIIICGHQMSKYDIDYTFFPIISAFKVGATSVTLENWNWKSWMGIQIYNSIFDLNILFPSASAHTKVYVKKNSGMFIYSFENSSWENTGEMSVGAFNSIEDLEEKYPNPKIGYFGYVGGYNGTTYRYTKYTCQTEGVWVSTSDIYDSATNPAVYGSNSIILNSIIPECCNGGFYSLSLGNKRFTNRIFSISGHYHSSAAFINQPNSNISEGGVVQSRQYSCIDYSTATKTNGSILDVVIEDSCLKNDPVIFPDAPSQTVHQKTANTLFEQGFDIVTLTNNNKIICTRIGVGIDREFNLD